MWPVVLAFGVVVLVSNFAPLWVSLPTALVALVVLFIFEPFNLQARLYDAEKKLEDLEELYDITVNTAELGLWDWNIAENTLYWSPVLWGMLGVKDHDRVPAFSEFEGRLHPDEKDWVTAALDNHLKHRTPYNYEFRFRHEGGHYVWIHTYATSTRDHKGVPARLSGFVTDISARRATEISLARYTKDLENSNAWLETLMQTVPLGILALETDGKIISSNCAVSECFGYEKEEMLGISFNQLIPEQFHDQLNCYIKDIINEKQLSKGVLFKEREVWGLKKDGQVIPLEVRLSVIIHSEGERFVIVTCKDISAQKQATRKLKEYTYKLENQQLELTIARERAEQLNQQKSEFMANISHEIRTPMNGIIGMASLMKDTQLNERQDRYIDIILSSSESMLKIINDLLDFSKIDSGKLELEYIDCDLIALLNEVVQLLASDCHEKGIEIILRVDPKMIYEVHSDPVRLKQILLNLASNAVKFTKTGYVLVSVSSKQIELNKYNILVSIADTGIGIAKDKIDNIFEQFNQADTSTTREYGGTGLGLSICRQLVNMMHGDLGVKSALGEGSIFWFSVPVEAVSNRYVAFDKKKLANQLKNKSVLLCLECDQLLKVQEDELNYFKMHVIRVNTGNELLSQVNKNEFDYVVLDEKIAQELSLQQKETNQTSLLPVNSTLVLLVANQSNNDEIAYLLGHSVDASLTKPISPFALAEMLEKVQYVE